MGEPNLRAIDERDFSRGLRAEETRGRVRAARIDVALQLGIALFTLGAIWLLTSDTPYARWGHVVGLLSQPFYIAASWRARQWGMFFVAVALVGLWLRGIANTF